MATPAPSILVQRHRGLNVERKSFAQGASGNNPNANLIFDVPRGGYIGYQILTLRGSLIISGGTASGTSLGENPGNLIQRVTVEASPAGQIKTLLPRSLIRRTVYDGGWAKADTALTGAAGTFTLLQPFFLIYALAGTVPHYRSPVPYESALQTDRFASVQVRVLGGGRDTQFSGNDRTFDFASVTVDLSQQVEFAGGDAALLLEDDLVKTISAANPQFTVSEFPLGSRYMDQLFIAETTNQALSDGIINRVTVRSGGLVFFDALEDEIKVNQQRWFTDAAVSATGLYLAPLNPDYMHSGAVDVRAANQLIAVLDVSNPGTDRVIVSSRRILLPGEDFPRS